MRNRLKGRLFAEAVPLEILAGTARENPEKYVARRWIPYGSAAAEPPATAAVPEMPAPKKKANTAIILDLESDASPVNVPVAQSRNLDFEEEPTPPTDRPARPTD